MGRILRDVMGLWAVPWHRSWDCRKGELTDAWASSSMGVLLSVSVWSCCLLRRSREQKLIKNRGSILSYIEHLFLCWKGKWLSDSLFIGACFASSVVLSIDNGGGIEVDLSLCW